jgi:membrane-bound ClpP family serine protease
MRLAIATACCLLAAGAQLIIFEFNTPGGRSDAMEDIAKLILTEVPDVYTPAYVDPEAYSAGAVIALACNEIDRSPIARLGDAMPIPAGTRVKVIGRDGIYPIVERI